MSEQHKVDGAPRAPVLAFLRDDVKTSDCIISVGDEEFPVHYSIVSCLVPFFRTALLGDFKEAATKQLSIGDSTPASSKRSSRLPLRY